MTRAIQSIPLLKVFASPDVQTRAAFVDEEFCEAMAEHLRAGGELPPVQLFFDGQQYWLADGFNRRRSYELAGRKHLFATVAKGGQGEALVFSAAANEEHKGLRRRAADRIKAAAMLLHHPGCSAWSDNKIADHVHLRRAKVAELRASCSGDKMRQVERGGGSYLMDTARIGERAADVLAAMTPAARVAFLQQREEEARPEEQETGDRGQGTGDRGRRIKCGRCGGKGWVEKI